MVWRNVRNNRIAAVVRFDRRVVFQTDVFQAGRLNQYGGFRHFLT